MMMLKRLPLDLVINHILPFTYRCQNSHLLEDLRHFMRSRSEVFGVYETIWIVQLGSRRFHDKLWLLNNLYYAIKNYYCGPAFLARLTHLQPKSRAQLEHYFAGLETQFKCCADNDPVVGSQINLLWGLLTPEERQDAIEEQRFNLRMLAEQEETS